MTNTTLTTIHDLHTTHGGFDDRPLPSADLDAVLTASVRAASASNLQTYSIVVVEDRALMKEVCGYQAAVLLVYCVDATRLADLARHLGHGEAYGVDPAWLATTGAVDAVMAMQTAVIAARALGIDSLVTNGLHRGDPERVYRLLDLPDRQCLPLIALLLGYDRQPAKVRKGRWCGPGLIHHERYHRCTPQELEAQTAVYDDPQQHLGLKADWAKDGHRHYLDLLFTAWMKPWDPTTPPTPLAQILHQHGFIPPAVPS